MTEIELFEDLYAYRILLQDTYDNEQIRLQKKAQNK
jgi:hypothetical protein